MIKLRVENNGESQLLEFASETVTFGRAKENNIKLEEKKASRKHGKLEVGPSGVVLTDLGSSNGTKLNGKPVTSATLHVGDVIQIGESRIVVESTPVSAAAAAAPAPAEVVTKEPVSADDRADFRRKIESRRTALDEAAAPAPAWKNLGIAAAVLVGVGIAAVLAVNAMSKDPKPAPVVTRPPVVEDEPDAKVELARLNTALGNTSRVTDTLLDDIRETSIRFSDVYAGEKSADNPFDALYSAALQKRADDQARIYVNGLSAFNGALDAKQYARARDAVVGMQKDLGTGVMANELKQLDDLWAIAVKTDFDAADDFARKVAEAGRFAEAERLALKSVDRFKDTVYASKLTQAATGYRISGEAAVARPLRPKYVPPADTDNPTTPTTPTTPDDTTPPAVADQPKDAPPPVAIMTALLIERIAAGDLAGRSYEFAEGKKGTIEGAEASGLAVSIGGQAETLAWSDVPAKIFHDMLSSCSLKDESRVAFGEWCYANALRFEGDSQLYKYGGSKTSSGHKERKVEIDGLLADWRGEPSPADGYEWHSKYGYEHPIAKLNRVALEEADEACNKASGIAKSLDEKKLDKNFEKCMEMINDPALTEETRNSISKTLQDALVTQRTLRMEKVKQLAKKDGAFKNLMAAKKQLDDARKEALRVIYDTSIYPDENHGIVGQPKVDEKVNIVKRLWDGSNVEAVISTTLAEQIQGVKDINDKYLSQLGVEPNEEEMKEYDDFVNNIIGKAALGIQTVAASGAERDTYAYNDKISIYNQTIFKCPNGVSQASVDQAEVNNGYRHKMGRRKLFMQPQLCLAAQGHTENQAAAGRIWHVEGNSTPGSRCAAQGFTGPVGENCAMGYDGADRVHEGWYNSSGHHRNMLSDSWNCIGVGNQGAFWTQNFGVGPKPNDANW